MTATAIPFANPAGDLKPFRREIIAAIEEVIDRGQYVLSEAVGAFERRMAQRLGVAGTVGVGSGTDALVLGLLAVGVEPGQEVITVSHTAGPTVAAVHMAGAVPVLVDIEADTYCLDPLRLESAIGPRTKAILPVHLYGHPAALDAICAIAARHGLAVVEDCAQAHDATIGGRAVGAIGDVGCFSFYPTKNLGAIGDGGLVSARDPRLVERLRRLRTYGWSKPQFSEIANGRCSRLDELQAAILSVKLAHLTQQTERRRGLASRYNEAFAGLPLVCPVERPGCRRVFHLYVIRCAAREALAAHLGAAGITTGRHYPYPVHRQPGLAAGARIGGPLATTERISGEILTLPLYPSLSDAQQERVIAAVHSFFATKRAR